MHCLTFITQRTLACAPLEALYNAVLHWAQKSFIYLQHTHRKKTDHLSNDLAVNKLSTPVHKLSQKQTQRVTCNHMQRQFSSHLLLPGKHTDTKQRHTNTSMPKDSHTSRFRWPKALFEIYVNTVRGEVKSNIRNFIHLQPNYSWIV